MDFRRSGQLDDRRRRVLMDEIASAAEVEKGDASGVKGPSRAYSQAVLADCQPRITDLIPVRPFLVTMILLLALTGVAALETLYIHLRTSSWGDAAHPLASRFAALDLASRGSVGAWYGACLLAVGSAAALVILSIRCHRVDDYGGRYRVWMWAGAALLWGSLDCASGTHHAIGAGMAALAGSPQLADLCWLGAYLLIFGLLAVRLGIEIWHSLAPFCALAVAVVLYLVAGMGSLGMWTIASPLVATVALSSVTLVAHVAVLAMLVLYARHVCLDAAGKLPLRLRAKDGKKKRKVRAKLSVVSKDDADDADQAADEGVTIKPAAVSQGVKPAAKAPAIAARPTLSANPSRPGPLASKVTASSASDEEEDEEDDETGDYDAGERLSKAERRRLKKMARREQQRRAA